MTNFTNTHKMTGVGNALKRHYQALCLDYELAHPQDPVKQVSGISLCAWQKGTQFLPRTVSQRAHFVIVC